MKAIALLPKAPRSLYLIESIVGLARDPARLNQALQILSALLAKPSDELRWSIQTKELALFLSKGLDSKDADTRATAGEVKDALLRLGFFDILELGD